VVSQGVRCTPRRRSDVAQDCGSAPAPPVRERLTHEQTTFLFRVLERLTARLETLAEPSGEPRTDAQRAGVHYLEVLRLTVRNTVVRAHAGLVIGEASQAWTRARLARRRMIAVAFEDLVQEGHLGLLTAVDRFDWRKGYRFSTFATVVIRRHIARALIEKEPLIYLPAHALACLRTVHTFSVRFHAERGRSPSPDEIAAATGISRDTVAEIHEAGRMIAEPDTVDRVEDLPGVVDDDAVDALKALVSNELERVVGEAMAALTPVEREVITHRFGLGGEPEQTQAQVGARMGYSQQRIAQVERRALLKLLMITRSRGIEARGDGTLDGLLAVLAEHGIGGEDALPTLARCLERSERCGDPRYLRARMAKLARRSMR